MSGALVVRGRLIASRIGVPPPEVRQLRGEFAFRGVDGREPNLPPREFELYRSPRVTLRLAQDIIRADATALAIRLRLRQAIAVLPHA